MSVKPGTYNTVCVYILDENMKNLQPSQPQAQPIYCYEEGEEEEQEREMPSDLMTVDLHFKRMG